MISAMSDDAVKVVQSLLGPFEDMNTAEIDWGANAIRETVGAVCSPDIELRTLESGIGTGVDSSYRGVDGVVRYLQDWLEPFGEFHSTWIEFIDAGDFVLVPNSHWGLGKGSGARVELEMVYACEVKDGLITRLLQYDTLDDAREAIKALA
jgi:ketosteroid isomerase-like protein